MDSYRVIRHPRPVLGESCTTSIKDFDIFPPHQKKKKKYPDFTQAFVVITDALNYGIGGVLSQGNVGKDPPVAYASRTLSDTEINYSTIDKELLAIKSTTVEPKIYKHLPASISFRICLFWDYPNRRIIG